MIHSSCVFLIVLGVFCAFSENFEIFGNIVHFSEKNVIHLYALLIEFLSLFGIFLF